MKIILIEKTRNLLLSLIRFNSYMFSHVMISFPFNDNSSILQYLAESLGSLFNVMLNLVGYLMSKPSL